MKKNDVTNIHLVLAMTLILVSCVDQAGQPPTQNVEETIINLERKALDQWSDGDPAGYFANFSEDATYLDDIGAQMRVDGAAELQEYSKILSGNIPKHQYELADSKVQVYNDVAILTLRYLGKLPGGEEAPPWKATLVYHFQDVTWKVVHANWSLIKIEQEQETAPEN